MAHDPREDSPDNLPAPLRIILAALANKAYPTTVPPFSKERVDANLKMLRHEAELGQTMRGEHAARRPA